MFYFSRSLTARVVLMIVSWNRGEGIPPPRFMNFPPRPQVPGLSHHMIIVRDQACISLVNILDMLRRVLVQDDVYSMLWFVLKTRQLNKYGLSKPR
jgi:hypothetical protein